MIPVYPFYPRCFECGGNIALTCKEGRTYERVRGIHEPIPFDVPIPTCDGCGDETWSVELSEYVCDILGERTSV